MNIHTLGGIALLMLGALAGQAPARAAEPSQTGPAHRTFAGAPTLSYLHLVGGSKAEQGARVAVGGSGNVFLAGTTFSRDWPAAWLHPCRLTPTITCGHAFLVKLSPDGTHVSYSVVLGGSRQETLTGLALDSAGNAYVTGTTSSPDFPTVHPLQPHCGGPASSCADGFVARIDPRGHVVYSTFLGGRGDDRPSAIAADRFGNAYIAGSTTSIDFPVTHAMQPRPRGKHDGFVTKLSTSGGQLIYSTYLGGSQEDGASAIAVDRLGQAYIAGNTASPDFRTSARSLQPHFLGGTCVFFPCDDVFVTKLGTAGRFLAGTFLATRANDVGNAIAVDRWGNVYVAGSTGASRIPSTQGTVTTGKNYCGEEGDIFPCQTAFVVELTPWLDHPAYSHMLGGNGLDRVDALAVDAGGAVVVGGYTESTDFPTVRPIQATTGGGECNEGKGGSAPCDGFVAAISPHGRGVTFSTYVGGNGQDDVESVALDGHRSVILAGTTWSGNLTGAASAPPSLAPRIFLGRIGNVLK